MDLDVLAARVAPVSERARGALGHKAVAWLACAPAPLRRRRRLGYPMQGHPILLLGYSAQESAHDRGHTPAVHMVSLAHLSRIRSRGTARRGTARRGLGRPAQDTIDVHALHPALGLGHRGHEGCRLLYPRDVDRTHSGQNRRHVENVIRIVVGEADLRSRPSTMRQPGGGEDTWARPARSTPHAAAAAQWAEGDALAAEHARRSPRASWGR